MLISNRIAAGRDDYPRARNRALTHARPVRLRARLRARARILLWLRPSCRAILIFLQNVHLRDEFPYRGFRCSPARERRELRDDFLHRSRCPFGRLRVPSLSRDSRRGLPRQVLSPWVAGHVPRYDKILLCCRERVWRHRTRRQGRAGRRPILRLPCAGFGRNQTAPPRRD